MVPLVHGICWTCAGCYPLPAQLPPDLGGGFGAEPSRSMPIAASAGVRMIAPLQRACLYACGVLSTLSFKGVF